jgi:hypothetical protein
MEITIPKILLISGEKYPDSVQKLDFNSNIYGYPDNIHFIFFRGFSGFIFLDIRMSCSNVILEK